MENECKENEWKEIEWKQNCREELRQRVLFLGENITDKEDQFDDIKCLTIRQVENMLAQAKQQAKRQAKVEVLEEIFQTCYQEDSRTLELVQEKLQDLKGLSLVLS